MFLPSTKELLKSLQFATELRPANGHLKHSYDWVHLLSCSPLGLHPSSVIFSLVSISSPLPSRCVAHPFTKNRTAGTPLSPSSLSQPLAQPPEAKHPGFNRACKEVRPKECISSRVRYSERSMGLQSNSVQPSRN